MHESRCNRRALLGRAAGLAGSLPVVSSVIAACIGADNEPTPTASPAPDTATPAPTASPEPSPTATATLTAIPTATPSAVPTATATEPSVPTPTPTLVPADPDLLAGLRELTLPFDTAEPESGFDDLEPLREIVGDARLVALGEATHGTSEFFKMKHRLTEFLVAELGFTIFAIEAPWPATKVINDYVHGTDATRAEILEGLTFWTWKTQEVIDLIEWMRAYNLRPGVTPVSFQAFDMQLGDDDRAVNQVLTFVEEVAPARVERFATYYEDVRHEDSIIPDVAGAQAALDDLLAHRNEYMDATATESYAAIVQTARMIVQFEEMLARGAPSSAALRDRYMAENVAWLLDQAGPAAKIVLWAHNLHVATAELSLPDGTTHRLMGSYLRERYDEAMVVMGFAFFSGTFVARESSSSDEPSADEQWIHEIPFPPPENAEHTLAQLGLERFMLDLRAIDVETPAGVWLREEHPIWTVGAVYNPSPGLGSIRVTLSLPRFFDVLIYFHDTHAAQRLI